MRLFGRLLIVALCVPVLVVFLGAGAVAFLFGTETGRDFARTRTQATIARLLGPTYASDLGEQTFEMRPDGTLAIGWEGVTLSKVGEAGPATAVDRVAFAVRLLPLVGGGLEFGRLEISGARIDLETLGLRAGPNEVPSVSAVADDAFAALERQLAALNAFRFETVAFNDISVEGLPKMPGGIEKLHLHFAELRRDGAGRLDLAAALSLGPLPLSLTGEAAFEGGRLQDLSVRSSPAEMRLVAPPGPPEDLRDERRFATDADLAVTLRARPEAQEGTLVSDLIVTSGPGAVQLGRNRTRIEQAELRFRHRGGEERIEIVESPVRFSGVSFDLVGEFEPVHAGSKQTRFRIEAPRILSRVGLPEGVEEPLEASLRAGGVLDLPASRAELTRLAFASGEETLEGSGQLDLSGPEGMTRIDLIGTKIGAPTLKAYWPFNLAGGARRWIVSHLGDEGRAASAEIAVAVRRDRFEGAFGREGRLRAGELRVDVEIEGADLSTFGGLPRLFQANGDIAVRGSRTRIALQDAMVEDHPAVAIGASRLVLTKPDDGNRRDTLFDFHLEAAGDAGQLLAIADAPPIRALRTLDFTPADVAGTARAKAHAQLRIGDEIEASQILRDWSVTADLMDASLLVPYQGRRFANLSGTLDVEPDAARAQLAGLMDDMPADIALSVPVGSNSSVERLVTIDLDVSAAKAMELVPAMRGAIEGPIAAELTQDSAGLRAHLDLTRTALTVPSIAWRKGGGVPATIDLSIVNRDGTMDLNDIRMAGAGFSAAGSATIDGQGLRSARLRDVALNPGDRISLSMDRSPNGFSLDIEGSRFDARPLLQELKASAGRPRSGTASGLTFDIAASIDTVRGFDERTLSGIELNYASVDGRLAALSVAGRTGQGAVQVDLSPRESGQALRVSTQDLGAFIGFAGLYGNMEAGTATLDLQGAPDGSYQGIISIQDFTLVDEPRLERFVGSEPVPGQGTLSQALGQDLRTSRAYFDQASAVLHYGDGRLGVSNGIIRGPVFGSSFAGILYDRESRIDIVGSFMPAYSVNRIFGSIPLVGRILGNGNEGGLLGLTYQLSGAFASPTLTVNPISIIAPGVFRQIFEY